MATRFDCFIAAMNTHRTIVVLAAAFIVAGCGKRPVESALPPGTVILALGDSLTYGTGASPDTSYPAYLAERTGWRIINGGVPGHTAAQGCERLPELLEAHRPKLVLVLLGGNDFLRRMPDAGIRSALEDCSASAKAAESKMILLSVPRFGPGGLKSASIFEEIGTALAAPVIDPEIGGVLTNARLRADPIHPNADGYRVIADTVTKALRARGLLAH